MILTQDELKSILEYNPETGLFTRKRKTRPYGDCKGAIVGGVGMYRL